MPKKMKRSTVITIIVTALLVVGVGYWLYTTQVKSDGGVLTASGTVEATEVQIAPEASGKVVEIKVEEGQPFNAGDLLFRMDDTMLQAQRKQAAAALQAAKDNLEASQSAIDAAKAAFGVAQANAESTKANAQAQLIPAQQTLDDLNKNAGVARAAADQALAAATRSAREAQYQVDNFTIPSDQEGLTTAEALKLLKERLDVARTAFEPYRYEDSNNTTRKDLKKALDNAQSSYDAAVRRMELETALAQANAKLEKANRDYDAVKDGPKAEDISAAEARIAAIQASTKQADAAVIQAETGISQAEDRLQQAKSSVDQAQAALEMIDVQIQKLSVYALTNGVLLARGIEPGEIVQAGAPVMTAGLLDNVNLTVYIPEDRYGEVKVGQQAKVLVDSFPGRVFTATVNRISDKAEFTPRNVQTVEGRKTTVFAVLLNIANPDMALKLGMPADVTFEQP
jgi:HlyD family secretion protein